GLRELALDYAPRWPAVKREAFVDWLRQGGIAHVLVADNGQRPVFTDELTVLNSPGRVGAGQVAHHEIGRRAIDDAWLSTNGFPAARLEEEKNVVLFDFAGALFRKLAPLTRPKHNWGLIYLLILCYMAASGPGAWVVGRKVRNYRLALMFLAGAIAGFSVVFG